jgi:RNA 2',3'-cyclic 3'-phosphodiesterase
MPRLFVAIDMPPEIKEEITSICYTVRSVRWVPQNQLHLTLRFIGEVNEADYHAIRRALHEIQRPSFDLRLKSVGHFPPRGHPRTIWVGVEKNDALMALNTAIESALIAAGVEPEKRKYHPHITVARVRDRTDPATLIPFLAGNNLFCTASFKVDEFLLYSSILKPEGALHQVEEAYPLP